MTITLEHLKGGTYYFPLKYTNVGLYMFKKKCVLIDSGATEEEGKEIYDYAKSKGLTLDSLIITHAHADNCAGAHYLKNKAKLKVFASKDEALTLENPNRSSHSAITTELKEVDLTEEEIEEEVLRLRKDPRMRGKDIMQFIPTKKIVPYNTVLKFRQCLVDGYLKHGDKFHLEYSMEHVIKQEFQIVGLPGHAFGQIGVITPDKIFFIGDALVSNKELEENPIPYVADITKMKKTLDYLLKSKLTYFVPTHGKPLEFTITAEVASNKRQFKMVEDTILLHLTMPRTTDELIALVLQTFDIEENIPNFYLISATIKAFLIDLKKDKKLKVIHEKGKTRWFADSEF